MVGHLSTHPSKSSVDNMRSDECIILSGMVTCGKRDFIIWFISHIVMYMDYKVVILYMAARLLSPMNHAKFLCQRSEHRILLNSFILLVFQPLFEIRKRSCVSP